MCNWPDCEFKGSARKDNLLRHMRKVHSKAGTTNNEDTCDVTSVRLAYDEAVRDRKQLEKGLTILKLVHDGNIISLKMLLREGGNVSEITTTGKTALHVAALNGHLDIIRLLLNTKIERNAKDTAGRSALHDAAKGGDIRVFRELM